MEFISIANVEEKGELEEFVEMLKLLEKRHEVKSVEIIIGELPEGWKGKRFSRLSDGVTKRRYGIGRIIMMDGTEFSMIEVERENKSLSMLILKSNIIVNWCKIYSILLLALVKKSGKWSNKAIKEIENKSVIIYRNKHNKQSIYEKEKTIYKKFYCI